MSNNIRFNLRQKIIELMTRGSYDALTITTDLEDANDLAMLTYLARINTDKAMTTPDLVELMKDIRLSVKGIARKDLKDIWTHREMAIKEIRPEEKEGGKSKWKLW